MSGKRGPRQRVCHIELLIFNMSASQRLRGGASSGWRVAGPQLARAPLTAGLPRPSLSPGLTASSNAVPKKGCHGTPSACCASHLTGSSCSCVCTGLDRDGANDWPSLVRGVCLDSRLDRACTIHPGEPWPAGGRATRPGMSTFAAVGRGRALFPGGLGVDREWWRPEHGRLRCHPNPASPRD
jgi:hypothetical protein